MKMTTKITFEQYVRDNYSTALICDYICDYAKGSVDITDFFKFDEALRFYDIYKDEIWKCLNIETDKNNFSNIFDYLANFTDTEEVSNENEFKYLLVQHAFFIIAEKIFYEEKEREEEEEE